MERARTRNVTNQKPALSRRFAYYPQVRASPTFGLITRRSRVQIPPPLLKALVSDLLTRVSTVPGTANVGSLLILPLSLPGLLSHL